MQDLDPVLRDQIDAAFRAAWATLASGDVDEAVIKGEAAWEMLPEPKFDWDVSKSYVDALALLYRDSRRFSQAVSLMESLFSSNTVRPHQDRPRFTLGTIYFEMGDMASARKWLSEANQISKGRCFREEPEKYRLAISKKQ